MQLVDWSPRERPEIAELDGQYVRLERLSLTKHARDLFETCATSSEIERAKFLRVENGQTFDGFSNWIQTCESNQQDEFYAVVDKSTEKAVGMQAFLRIDEANGSVEIGWVHWSAHMARSPKSTEAFFLMASYVFDQLGYRRFEWKCDSLNLPSCRAAERFGMQFEGVFRNHMVRYGANRDTAWFSLIDREWPATKRAFTAWFDPENFDKNDRQKVKLTELINQERDRT